MGSNSKSIRIDRAFLVPDDVREALLTLHSRGYVAYLVGGCVRDFLLGRPTKDYDIATNAHPDEIVKYFPNAIDVGRAFGVIKVPRAGQTDLEIATFREDLDYQDHRHPQSVRFAGPAEDATRRDFTINALYYDIKSSRIYDFFDGVADLKARVLRAIGNPAERFHEDALRLVRAVRFASVLPGFEIAPETLSAIREKSALIIHVSKERVRAELSAILLGANPGMGFRLLDELGLLEEMIPELARLKTVEQSPLYRLEVRLGDISRQLSVWDHTLRMLDLMARLEPARSATLAFAVLFQGLGKGVVWEQNQRQNFNNHEREGSRLAVNLCERFRLSTVETEDVGLILENQLKAREVFQMRDAVLERWVRERYFPDFLRFHRIDALTSDGNLAFFDYCMSRLELRLVDIPKLVDGKDLISLGFAPGPEFSRILTTVEDLALEGRLRDKNEALEYIVRNFVR